MVSKPSGGAISVVDLFCGVGGLTHGFILEGIRVIAGVDVDPACRYPYEKNNGCLFIEKDVESLSASEIAKLYPSDGVRVLAGCAPCQPFSTYTQARNNYRDPKWRLLDAFAGAIEGVKPEIVTMENVPYLVKRRVYNRFVSRLRQAGYTVTVYRVYCPGYGVPQTRTRLVVFGSTLGPVKFVPTTHSSKNYRTVRQAIGHLEPLAAGGVSSEDPLHRSSRLSPRNLQRIRASRPGGTWREWEPGLVAKCHRKRSGKTYPGVYGRMRWNEPAPTITTQFFGFGNGRFGHPVQDRALSLREGALLQTFPEDYEFIDPDTPVSHRGLGQLIGNAVPVRLARAVAKSICRHVERYA